MAQTILIRRGLKKNLPELAEGELGFCTDTKELFIGSNSGNKQIGGNPGSVVTDSATNGFLVIDGTEIQVYDDTALQTALAGKANTSHTHTLSDISDVDVTTAPPSEGQVLAFQTGVWKPTAPPPTGNTYEIELARWGIKNDGSMPAETTKGINDAIAWAKSKGYNHVFLGDGTYKLRIKPWVWRNATGLSFTAIDMVSDMHFEMSSNCVLQLEGNTSPGYSIIQIKDQRNVKISGGKIVGDRKSHGYEMFVRFQRGGVNADGSLNDDPNWIRSEVIDRYAHPGLLNNFRLWSIPGVTATNYYFYQYKDKVSAGTLVNFRDNGGFAPKATTGRGWFLQPDITANNKMVFAINIKDSPLSDDQIAAIQATVDNSSYTHEWGTGIESAGSNHVEISNIEICDCTGDAISTGWLQYHTDPALYTQEQMGSYVTIQNCDIHHCRRNGIVMGAANDVSIYRNKIHHIGKSDDNKSTSFRDGTPPMFGIDIESLVGESNISHKNPYYSIGDGLEVNFRIHISNNYIYENERGHFVNPDGNHVTLANNTFEGWNVGGISNYATNMYVQYLNNTFIGCELTVVGDDVVNGAVFHKGNLKFSDIHGTKIHNVRIKDGLMYGSSSYGYFGTPTVNTETGTLSYSVPHGMGNTAKVCFEQWVGKVPAGISVDKIYYVVNRTDYTFQVSEAENGPPVTIYDSGEWGFNISRYNYGRCYISDVVIERDWNSGGVYNPSLTLTGGVVKDFIVKNYSIDIMPPQNYVGRPVTVEGLTVIDGGANIASCHLTNSKFFGNRAKMVGVNLGFSNSYPYIPVSIESCLFQNADVLLYNTKIINSTFTDSILYKGGNEKQSIVSSCWLENSFISAHWLTQPKVLLITKCILQNVTTDINFTAGTTVMLENTDISSSLADLKAPTITAKPNGGIFNKDQTVTLTANETATIYYTTDGTEPTTGSLVYSSALTIQKPTTIKCLAVDSAGNISPVKSFFFNIDKMPPNEAANLAASVTNAAVSLFWTASPSPDVANYEILNGAVVSGTTTNTSYTVTGLAASTTYTFTVKAVDKAGNKTAGVSITAKTTEDLIPPTDVSNLLVTAIAADTIGLTWTKSPDSDVAAYEVYQGAVLLDRYVSAPSFSVSGLSPSAAYTFTVKSRDINNNTSSGVSVKATTSASTGYVTNGLVLYLDQPADNTTIPNPDGYFHRNNPFTMLVTVKLTTYSNILNRSVLGGTMNTIRFETNGNNQFEATFYGKDSGNTNVYPYIVSTAYPDLSSYYHLALVRSATTLMMYVNNVKVGETGLTNDVQLNESTLPMLLGGMSQKPTAFKNAAYYNRALTAAELTQNYNVMVV